MKAQKPSISPLRQRMIEDMRMRKLGEKTQYHYLRAVRQFAKYLGRSPDTATVEELRNYQLHLVDHGISPVSLNAAITGLKFFCEITLDRPELMAKMQPVRVPRTLPVVLSREEVARLIAAAGNLKHQTALSVAYGTGLRAGEVIALKVGDIDSQRMTLRVERGKGQKDRYAMLSPVLLERLRVWWRVARAQGKMLDGGWLFPGLNPVEPLSSRQLNRAIKAAATAAGIDKRVSMHTLRHSFATHLLEQAEREGARVFNKPRALRDHPEKLAIMEFPQFIGPTLVTRDAAQIRRFHEEHKDIILKPLHTIGNMATPMSLIYLGGLFALTKWWGVLKRYELYVGLVAKMIAFPLAFYALLTALTGALPQLPITHDMVLMITVIAGLPTMTTIAMFTGRKNNMPEYAVGFVLVSTLFSLASLTIVSAVVF